MVLQILVLDQTKTVAECAQQLLYAAKESGGNPKATHVHADIDESAEAMSSSIYDLQASIKKLEPQIGSVSRIVNCITEAIFTVEDYRPGSRQGQDEDSTFVLFQVRDFEPKTSSSSAMIYCYEYFHTDQHDGFD